MMRTSKRICQFLLVLLVIKISVFYYIYMSHWESPDLGWHGISVTKNDERRVVFLFHEADQHKDLHDRMQKCVCSLLQHSRSKLMLYVIGDLISQDLFIKTFERCRNALPDGLARNSTATGMDMDSFRVKLEPAISPMQRHFSSNSSYYGKYLFFLSAVLHMALPISWTTTVLMDVDTLIVDDIGELFDEFSRFDSSNLIGLAHEMQPTYRHTFDVYRREHPNTPVGAPPPAGHPGFNSGVLLLHLQRLRQSTVYGDLLRPRTLSRLTDKYRFKGHLGDQDFFTLVSLDRPELFRVISCRFNVQLCSWWRDNGYADVFEQYHVCNQTPVIYHGNCKTPFPTTV